MCSEEQIRLRHTALIDSKSKSSYLYYMILTYITQNSPMNEYFHFLDIKNVTIC